MAISEAFTGSASISTTEYDLPSASTTKSSQTSDGIFQVFLDLSAMTATESYRLRIYEKTRSSTVSQGLVEDITISGVQSEPVYVTPPLLFLHAWTVTLTLLQGTPRTIEWSIRQVA